MKNTKFIQQFTPNWFAVTMGTGGTALVLNHFAKALPLLGHIAAIIWLVNIILFITFSFLLTLRFITHPHHIRLMLAHPVQPLFLGCIPMGLITIVNGFMSFGCHLFDPSLAFSIAHGLWWLDVALSLFISWLIPFAMFMLQDHELKTMTPVWLLPLVACEVAASSGGLLIPHISTTIRPWVFVVSWSLWSISVLLAFGVIAIFFKRLVLHSLPDKMLAPSIWLVLGPIGTGVLGLITISQAAGALVGHYPAVMQQMLEILPSIGLWAAIVLWGLGFWWFITALVSTAYHWSKGMEFSLSWWAFTFPLAVLTLGTFAIADHTQMAFFNIAGIIGATLLVIFWLNVSYKTLIGTFNQTLFSAPCLIR
ncbi:TDT family transporter [Piscirickettsia litoralis]|uniref:C4-dicarboxylate ABC transporter n=1 Tax=Piscirickettsia litoralis TaxID=1891921 RepID=A0ABX3A2Y0_9GAMM|nr:TDT family transporter [Piscirickettsia litoralis]ODN43198.1 hypothetical protein BGC07_10055 [Piscirickettsia litoralis]